MTVTLSPDQLAWVEARVARGDYNDLDEAVHDILVTGMAGLEEAEADDMAWAKPLVDEALAAIERGDTMTLDQFEAHLDEKFGKLPG